MSHTLQDNFVSLTMLISCHSIAGSAASVNARAASRSNGVNCRRAQPRVKSSSQLVLITIEFTLGPYASLRLRTFITVHDMTGAW